MNSILYQTEKDYEALYAWSIAERCDFWSEVWDYCSVKGDRGGRALIHGDDMLAARFFLMP
ncbi:hypothetical protein ACVMIH_007666 [Bradyrhizobium sp. USDA 4503]